MGKDVFIVLILMLCACNAENSAVDNTVGEFNSSTDRDTIIYYDIYDLSSEGGEASVSYKDKRLDTAYVILYAESGRTEIHLNRVGDSILMRESIYKYDAPIQEVKSNDDIRLAEANNYRVAISDAIKVPALKPDQRGTNILREFRQTIKFTLEE